MLIICGGHALENDHGGCMIYYRNWELMDTKDVGVREVNFMEGKSWRFCLANGYCCRCHQWNSDDWWLDFCLEDDVHSYIACEK